jgi:uncharacterized protein YukE
MYGADVAELRALAQAFDRSTESLSGARQRIGSGIRIAAWVGPFAVRFRSMWDNDHSRQVDAAARSLREAAEALRRNADDQDATSRVDGAGSGRSTAVGQGGSVSSSASIPPSVEDWIRKHLSGAASLSDMLRIISSAQLPPGVKIWDLVLGLAKAGELKGFAGMKALGVVGDVVQINEWINKIANNQFDGHDTVDTVAMVLKKLPVPVVGKLGGAALSIWNEVSREVEKADLTPQGVKTVVDEIKRNPGVLVEEVGKAVMSVGSKLIGWLL